MRRRVEVGRLQEQESLLHLPQTLLGLLEPESIAQATFAVIRDRLHPDAISLLVQDAEGTSLVLIAGEGWVEEHVGRLRLPLDAPESSGVTWAVHTRTSVWRDHTYGDQPVVTPDVVRRAGVQTSLIVPMLAEERTIGVLVLDSLTHRTFSDDEVRFLSLIAGQAGIALDRAREHQAARQAEARYRGLFDGTPVGLYRSTPSGQILDANPALVRMLGYPDRETLLKVNAADLYVEPRDRARWLAVMAREGTAHDFETRMRRCDGTVIWVRDSARAVRGEGGTVLCYEGSLEDITARKRAEENLRRRAERLAAITRVSREITSAPDLRAVLTSIARHAAELSQSDASGVFTFRPDGYLYIEAAYGVEDTFLEPGKAQGIPLGKGAIGRAAAERRPVQVFDTLTEPDYPYRQVTAIEGVRAVLAVPMLRDGEVMGGIVLWHRQPRRFTPEEVTFLQALAQQCVNAVENARLYEQATKRADQMAIVHALGQQITPLLDVDQLLQTAAEALHERFGYLSVQLYLLDEDTGELEARGVAGKEGLVVRGYRQKVGQGITGRAAERGERVLIGDVSQEPNFIPCVPGIRSELVLPIRVADRVVGVLNIESDQRNGFDEADVIALEALAGQLGAALEGARLFEAERRRAAHQEALNAIIAAAASASELPDLLETTLNHVLQALELEMGAIWVANRLALRGLPPEIGPASARAAQAVGLDIPGPVAVADWQDTAIHGPFDHAQENWLSAVAPLMARFGIRASLTVPILAEGERVGGLAVAASQARAWSTEEIALVEAVGRQLGAAAERLRLFQETQARAVRMDRLASLSEALNRPFTVAEVVDVIGQGAMALSGVCRAAVYLRHPDDTVTCPWFQGLSPEYVEQVTARTQEIPGGRLLESTEPVLLPDVKALPENSLLRGLAEAEGYRAVALWPLVYEGRVVAAVGCYHDTPHPWSEVEQEVMGAFCRQAAVAIENARLFEAEQRRAQEAETLRQAGAAVVATLDLDEAIHRILEQLEQVVPYDSASVQLLRDGYVEIVGGRGWADPTVVLGLCFPIPGDNPNTVVIQERRPCILGDAPAAYPPFRKDPHSHIQSWLGVPLITHDRVIGMLTVDSTERHHFTQEHARLVAAFADQVAIAIENAKLFEEAHQRAEELRLLFDVTRDASASLDPDEVLVRIAAHLCRAARATSGHIMILDESGERATVRAQYWGPEASPRERTPDKGTVYDLTRYPTILHALRENRPLITHVDDPDLEPEAREMMAEFDGCSALRIPMRVGGVLRGYALIWESRGRHEWTDEDVRLCQTLANQAAVAIDNARLYAAERHRTQELEALNQATTSLLTTLDRETLLDRILSAAIRAIQAAEKGTLLLVDRETGKLQVRAVQGYSDPRVRTFALAFAANEGPAARAVREGRPLLIDDTLTHPSLRHDGDIPEVREVRSAVVVPLMLGEEAIGALSLEASRRAAFTRDDLRLLVAFAATATAAIHNAQLHAEVQELAITDSLTGLYNRRGFFELGRREIERARRFRRPLTAIMFDLDHFKRVNDTYGHAIGDQVLVGLAARCQKELREVDLLGRYGGEEFVALLPETELAAAWRVAERLRRGVGQRAIPTDRGPIRITLSLGIAVLDEECVDLEALLARADQALYAAKQGGRNRVCMWEQNGQ